jgi:hypothetical protein
LFPSEEVNAGCSALLVCHVPVATCIIGKAYAISYRADGEDRLDAVVEVRVEERDLLHNHWA